MKTLLIITALIIAGIWLFSSKKEGNEITSQDGLDDCVEENKVEGERYVNDHVRSVITHPATEKRERRYRTVKKHKRK